MYMRNIALLMFLVCSTALTTTAAGQTRLKAVSLKVTVNAYEQTGTATAVSPDALGPSYIDGQNGVCASLDTNGDLIINLSCKGNSTSRQLGVDLGAFIALPTGGIYSCTPPTIISPSNPPVYTNWISTWAVTDATNPTAAPAFQNMNVGQIYYVGLTIATGFSDPSQTIYFLSYHRTDGIYPVDAALASYAQVRRMSLTQWVVEPVTPSRLNSNPNVAMLVEETTKTARHQSTTTTTECGFYQAPFSFTLEKN
jgi:hypothetical protein